MANPKQCGLLYPRQFYDDLISKIKKKDGTTEVINNCKKDCDQIRVALERYGITDLGPPDKEGKDLYIMDNPTMKRKDEVVKNIKLRLREHPNDNFLIVFVLAGHGMHESGK